MEKTINFKALAVALTVCLAISLSFNVYSSLNTSDAGAKTFVYEWPHGRLVFGQQLIANGTLHLEITFDWEEDALSINATINDDDYDPLDYIGLVFDRNSNGFIDVGLKDRPYVFFANNKTCTTDIILHKTGKVYGISFIGPKESPYHNCTFIEDGYTFDILIPKSELSDVKANMVHFYFQDRDVSSLQEAEMYWVSLTLEGWQ